MLVAEEGLSSTFGLRFSVFPRGLDPKESTILLVSSVLKM